MLVKLVRVFPYGRGYTFIVGQAFLPVLDELLRYQLYEDFPFFISFLILIEVRKAKVRTFRAVGKRSQVKGLTRSFNKSRFKKKCEMRNGKLLAS